MFPIADLFRLRPRNVRTRLLRDLTLVIFVTSGAIVALAVSSASKAERSTARAHIERASTQAQQEFRTRMEPVDRRLRLTWEWGKAGLLDSNDRPTTLAKLAPVLEPLPMVTALIIADSEGHEFLVSRDRNADGEPEGWVTRTSGLHESKGQLLRERWSEQRQLVEKFWIDLPGYVPTERPWFVGAVSSAPDDEIYRTEPYQFFERKQLGVTESMRWTPVDGNTHVVAFDLLLGDVFAVVSEIEVSDGGETFLCKSNGDVFVPYRARRPGEPAREPQHVFVDPAKTGSTVIERAVAAWLEAGGKTDEPVRFRAGDVSGWAGFRLVNPLSGIWMGVAVPEPEIFGATIDWTPQLIVIIALVLLLGLLPAVTIVRKYSHQLKDIPKQLIGPKTFERDVQELIARGEGPTLEFKSTVRMNLKTEKFGKEIELAWLKSATAFMNSDGGTLLIGVSDDGEVLGVEHDKFDNEDKCRLHLKNLVNQHIGAEFSRLIRFVVQPIDAKTVVAVQCERSAKPVFLKGKNRESFYIRSGPSSVELSPREVLEYVNRRT
ncbi:MAG: ATP-binding protein [Deltaproteobacteria bacterium]|nr:ATP-binding protein [Deltaproteobacteria bacterium]